MMKTEKACKIFVIMIVSSFVFVAGSFAGLDFKTVDTAQLHSMIVDNAYELEGGREKPFTIIDARTKEEYDSAHIASAVSVPEKDFGKSIAVLPRDKGVLIVVYCGDTESETGKQWAQKAAAAGYTNIVIYADGFRVWKENKLPIVPFGN